MNNAAGALMLCLVLLGPMVAYAAYRVLKWTGAPKAAGWAVGALLLGLAGLLGLSFAGGHAETGIVAQKTETVQFGRQQLLPSVIHILRLRVDAGAAHDLAGQMTVAPDPRQFDALRQGDRVRLQVSALGPFRSAHL